MTYPLVIIDSSQLAFYISIGVVIGLFIFGPLGAFIGMKIKRLPRHARLALVRVEMLEKTLHTRDKELADAESRNADLTGEKMQSVILHSFLDENFAVFESASVHHLQQRSALILAELMTQRRAV